MTCSAVMTCYISFAFKSAFKRNLCLEIGALSLNSETYALSKLMSGYTLTCGCRWRTL